MHDICVTKRYIRIDKVSAVAVNRVGCRLGGCWGRGLAQGKRGGGKVDEGIWLGLG